MTTFTWSGDLNPLPLNLIYRIATDHILLHIKLDEHKTITRVLTLEVATTQWPDHQEHEGAREKGS
jgi:hypothetical protein